jgi:hypothetical protein
MLGQLRGPWGAAQRAKLKDGRAHDIGGMEGHLLVTLIHCRCHVAREFLGYFHRVDRSAICRAVKRAEAVVQPLYGVRRDPKLSRREAEAIIIDCTERPAQRPQDDGAQKQHHSGKKKRHTLKTECGVARGGRTAAVSQSHPGSRHDLAIRREGARLPKRARLRRQRLPGL